MNHDMQLFKANTNYQFAIFKSENCSNSEDPLSSLSGE